MSIFLITSEDEEKIKIAAKAARQNPITLEMLRKIVKIDNRTISDNRLKEIPKPQEIILNSRWRINISYEEQTIGMCLHISICPPTSYKILLRREEIMMTLKVFGYNDISDVIATWKKEFKTNEKIVEEYFNILVLAKEK